jgi:hypothetical protein
MKANKVPAPTSRLSASIGVVAANDCRAGADDELADPGRAVPRMDAREHRPQQTVIGHGGEDAALAVEQHQDDRGEPDQRTDLDQQRTTTAGRWRARPRQRDRRR